MATIKKKAVPVEKSDSTPQVIKSQASTDNIVINNMPIILRSVDRMKKDIGDWWNSLKIAEQPANATRVRLYDIYSTIRIDGFLSGIIEKRIASIINKEIYFEKDGKKVEEMEDLVNGDVFRYMLRELMEQKFWGITGMEFVPGAEFKFNIIPRKHIKPEAQIITKEQFELSGVSYADVWNLWVVGKRDDLGLLLKCCPYVLWKKGVMGDWAQYIEIFGQPVIIIKYDGNDQKTKTELDNMMANAGGSTRIQIPTQANFEMLDGKTSNGNGDLQNQFRQACNEELSVIILGATETTTSSRNSGYAQSKTHAKQQQEILKADMIDMKILLNTKHFLNILKSYGYPVDGGKFCFEQEADIYEMQAKLSIVTQISKMGVPVSDDFLYELSAVPKPENYDQLKLEMANKKKTAVLQPPVDEGTEQKDENSSHQTGNEKPTPSNVPNAKKENDRWRKFRMMLADFFDPAP